MTLLLRKEQYYILLIHRDAAGSDKAHVGKELTHLCQVFFMIVFSGWEINIAFKKVLCKDQKQNLKGSQEEEKRLIVFCGMLSDMSCSMTGKGSDQEEAPHTHEVTWEPSMPAPSPRRP